MVPPGSSDCGEGSPGGSGGARAEERVKELIVELLFLKDTAPQDIGDDDVLAETLGVDSVALFQIVAGLEEAFEISFEEEDFQAERFETVRAIAEVVREKLGAEGSS